MTEKSSADQLRELLSAPGTTVYTLLRHKVPSGMTRWISPFAVRDNEPWDITFSVADVLGRRVSARWGGVKCDGCGMDMGFELVYSLSRRLWPEGYECLGEMCNSNDHVNPGPLYTRDGVELPGRGAMEYREYLTWASEHGAWHREGGYRLSQKWM